MDLSRCMSQRVITIQVISFSSYFGTVGLSQALDWNVSFQMSDQVQQRALFEVHVSEHEKP